MKRKHIQGVFFLVSFLGLISLSGYGQTNNSISGQVLSNDSTGSPLAGAAVQISGTNRFVLTDGNGVFYIKNRPEGDLELVITSLGYEPKRINIPQAYHSEKLLGVNLRERTPLLREAVVVGSERQMIEHPGSVQVINSRSLNRFQYTDVHRILREVPGMNIREEDGFGLRPNIGLRGSGVERSSKICVMEDGILVAPAPYTDPAAYYFPTAGRMSSVEVMKGSSQIKYGPFTTGGAINFVSTPIPEELSGKVSMSMGSFGTKQVHAHGGKSGKHFGILAETFQHSSDGFKHLEANQKTGFAKQDYLLKMMLRTDPSKENKHSLLLKAGGAYEVSDETYLGLTKKDFEADPFRRYQASMKDQMKTDQNQLSAHYQAGFVTGTRVNVVVYHQQFNRNWYRIDNVLDTSGKRVSIASIVENESQNPYAYAVLTGVTSAENAIAVRANNRRYVSKGAQLTVHQEFSTGKLKHATEAGMRLHEDRGDRFQWQDDYTMRNGIMLLSRAGTHGTETNRIETSEALSGYLQHRVAFGSWTFYPGVRYENILASRSDYGQSDPGRTGLNRIDRSNRTQAWMPGAALSWVASKQLNVFAGVHKGFSPAGNAPGARPEESINYEAGVKGNHAAVQWQFILFYNDYTNLLGADLSAVGGAGTGELFNAGQSKIKGAEFSINGNLAAHFNMDRISLPYSATYTYTLGRFGKSFTSSFADWTSVRAGDEMAYMAPHQASAFLGIEYEKIALNVNLTYQDQMRIMPGKGPMRDGEYIPSWLIADLSLNITLIPQLRLFGGVNNVFNEHYLVSRRPSGYRPGLPRMLNAGACFRF